MKVKVYRTVCEVMELPDEYFEIDPHAGEPGFSESLSMYCLTGTAAEEILMHYPEEEEGITCIEDMDGRLIAEA